MNRSYILAVSGGSGSGKTTFSRQMRETVGEQRCGVLYQDSYYRDQSSSFDRDGGAINFDHPDALEFSLLAKHLRKLKAGEEIHIPFYDFSTHTRLDKVTTFEPRTLVIVDGILLLSQENVRNEADLSIFIDTKEELRFNRRLERDVRERGRTEEGVKAQFLNHVKPMHDQFVEPSKDHSHKVVSGEKDFGPEVDAIVMELKDLGVSI